MRQFGIAMELCEQHIREVIQRRLSALQQGEVFHYVEIGVAEARTLSAVAELLQNSGALWRATGVDIEGGWSLNPMEILSNIAELDREYIALLYCGSQKYFTGPGRPIDFLLIDGCHAEACCRADFVAAERHIKQGGYVCFHDSGPMEQGMDVQPHCEKPIGVRSAMEKLGLLSGDREGWVLVKDVESTDATHNRGCAIFQKL